MATSTSASTSKSTPSPLDQLEAQVNLVLQHTGRIFAASARNQKPLDTISSAARLNQVYTTATNDFHDALDVLEAELALARAVLRRDLAVFRTEALAVEQRTSKHVIDNPPATTNSPSQPVTINDTPPNTMETSTANAVPDLEIISSNVKPEQSTESPKVQPQHPQNPLQIEIPSGEHQGDNSTDAATGTYSNFDFESLFNDPSTNATSNVGVPTSEDPSKAPPKPTATAAPPVPPTNLSTSDMPAKEAPSSIDSSANRIDNNNDGFDFGDHPTNFGGETGDVDDGDNISSLLPGLESYANGGPSDSAAEGGNMFDAVGAPDLGSSTAAGTSSAPFDAGKDQGKPDQQQQQDGNVGDDTFDLMDFDNFDLSNFVANEDDQGGDAGDTGFDASFFEI